MDTQGRDRKRRFLISGVLVVCACLVGLVDVGYAQVQTGSIIGTAKDESGGVLPGVTATLTSPALPAGPATVVSDATGQYRVANLAPGTYTLTLTLEGFSTYVEEGLRVAAGGTTQRDVTLPLVSVAETITVSGAAPIVDTRRASVSVSLPAEEIELLPSTRYSRNDLEITIPGVNQSGLKTTSHVANVMGSPSFETSFLLDGAVTNHPGSGGGYSIGDTDAFDELQVTLIGASAEYQIAQGGVINAVIKSGTNQFKGEAKAFWSPDALTSKPLKLPCNCPLGETGFINAKTYDYGVHAGGPLVRNRVWFFGGYADWKVLQTNPGTDPTQADPESARRFVAKTTWQINDGLRFTGTFHDELWTIAGIPTISRPYRATNSNAGSIPVYVAEVTKTSSKTLLTARASGWYFLNRTSMPLSRDLTAPQRLDQRTGLDGGGVAQFQRENGGRHMLAFKVNRFGTVGRMEHNLGAGVQEEFAFQRIFAAWPSGVQYYDLGGAPDYALFRDASSLGSAFNTQGVWGQDEMTLDRLTLTLGLRYDRLQGVSRDLPKVDNLLKETGTTIKGLGPMFTWTNTWSPRVGFNLRVTGDARTILRGTYGRYYRAIILNDFSEVHPGVASVTQARFDPATGGYTTILSVTNARDNITVDPNMIAPSTDQYSIGLDSQVANNMGASVSYVYKSGKNQVGWKDIGGVYGERTELLPNGQILTVYPLLNSPRERLFQRTNGPGLYGRYQGIILAFTKRLSQGWQGDVSYTFSRAEGMESTRTIGQDPNDLTNNAGRLGFGGGGQDRPHSFKARGAYLIPKVDMTVSTSIISYSGIPIAPQALVSLPQGRKAINIAPPGTHRTPRINRVDLTFDKTLLPRAGRQLHLTATLFNLLQDQGWDLYFTPNVFSPNFMKPSQWSATRRLTVAARAQF